MACLVVIEGPSAGRYFALDRHHLVSVGRDDECTFQVLDPQVSRRHLQIEREDDGNHVVRDYRSANGVMVNNASVQMDTRLRDGDVIRLGATAIAYSATDYPDAETAHNAIRARGEWRRDTMVRK
jgi:pSer/pThr/pTyr-binding forkhead associated (FHA) protein